MVSIRDSSNPQIANHAGFAYDAFYLPALLQQKVGYNKSSYKGSLVMVVICINFIRIWSIYNRRPAGYDKFDPYSLPVYYGVCRNPFNCR